MAIPDSARIALVPAVGEGEEKRMTWARFKADHPDIDARELVLIEQALENGIAHRFSPAKDAPVVYIVRR